MEALPTDPAAGPLTTPSGHRPFLERLEPWMGVLLMLAGIGAVGLYMLHAVLGTLVALAFAGVGVLLWVDRYPGLLLAGLWVVAPFNYGFQAGGAKIKLTELVILAMLSLIVIRLIAGDRAVWARLRRAALPIVCLGLLGAMAVITAVPHPNVFNVRYEIFNYVACVFALLFFRRDWWPMIIGLFLTMMLLESLAALILKFVFGLTGTNLFDVGAGAHLIRFTSEDLETFAGGRFRLAGTMGHKNMLAAFYVLMLPLVGVAMLRRFNPLWLLAIVPSLAVLAMTDSMTGWGAVVLMTAIALIHLRRFDYLAWMMLILIPLGVLALIHFGQSIFFRIEQLLSGQEGQGTATSRLEILRISLRLIREYPWMGIGRNNFLDYGQTFYGHAHNLFLMKVIEMGIPAGLAFAGFIVAAMVRVWRSILFEARRLSASQDYYHALGLWLGCLGFLAMNLLDYNYSHFSLGPMFMFMLGILLALSLDLETVGKQTARIQVK